MIVPFDPSKRGLTPAYRPGTHCPGCGHRNWIIGRLLAECGRCATAIPRADAVMPGRESVRVVNRRAA